LQESCGYAFRGAADRGFWRSKSHRQFGAYAACSKFTHLRAQWRRKYPGQKQNFSLENWTNLSERGSSQSRDIVTEDSMKVIAIATIKGGVGKSVLSAHLAAAMARMERQTLLMDLDPQGHSTLLAGVDVHPDAACVGDTLLRETQATLDEVILRDVRPK